MIIRHVAVLLFALFIATLKFIFFVQPKIRDSIHLIHLDPKDPLFFSKKSELKSLGYRYDRNLKGWIHPKALL